MRLQIQFAFVALATVEIVACGGSVDSVPASNDPSVDTSEYEAQSDSEGVPSPARPAPSNAAKQWASVTSAPEATQLPSSALRDLERDWKREQCGACRGEWGKHGISPFESCNCRTNDYGKECRAEHDCEGQCLADEVERIVTNPGPPALGYFVGTCSEFQNSYGCHHVLPSGFGDEPRELDASPPWLCRD